MTCYERAASWHSESGRALTPAGLKALRRIERTSVACSNGCGRRAVRVRGGQPLCGACVPVAPAASAEDAR